MKQKHIYNLAALLLASSAAFISCSDTDLDGPQTDGDRGASVVFNIKDIQQDNIAKVDAATRAGIAPTLLYTPGLTQEDLAPCRLEAVSSDGLDACLIETTVEGINPTKPDPSTRAKVETSIEHDFTSLGYRGETAGTISDKPEWFYSKKTKKNGELYETHFWSWGKPYGRFYAIYPEATAANKITLSPATHQGTPYLDFEVEEDVADQKDLMTACSGVVHYDTQNTAPTTNLEFRHALTAIKFAVGNNLSWGKQISNIEIRNAVYKGRYNLSDKLDGNGAGWVASSLTARKDFSLTVSPTIDTKKNPGAIITGTATDNYTFYMIPQELTGKNVEAVISFTDFTFIQVTLTGTWKAGTTKTYKLSHNSSNWTYQLTVESPAATPYDQTTSGNYKITSYRHTTGAPNYPVKWEIVGYDANGDNNFTMAEKPAWLASLSKTSGDGGTIAEIGTATLNTEAVHDFLDLREKELKEAEAQGTSANPYDLSTKGSTDPSKMNTANCYVISAAGYYKLPLVYGNAIKNGTKNESSYKSSKTGTYILSVFQDHAGQPITDPWIGVSNGGANVPTAAKLIWADEPGLVTTPQLVGSGNNAYLRFRVPNSSIKSGNAVLAVVNNSGTVLWSWHLWFAPKSVLEKVKITNADNNEFDIMQETLGWKYTEYKGTNYKIPRSVKVKVRQTTKDKGVFQEAEFTITQKTYSKRSGYSTLYQFGRKEPMPGTNTLAPGSTFTHNYIGWLTPAGAVKRPDAFFPQPSGKPSYYAYFNLWSAEDETPGIDDDLVVKTVYDPSPAGFKMPQTKAFSNLIVTTVVDLSSYNTLGGHEFWTNSGKTTSIYFPSSGHRIGDTGVINGNPANGFYWSSSPWNFACGVDFFTNNTGATIWITTHGRAAAFSVRPMADE